MSWRVNKLFLFPGRAVPFPQHHDSRGPGPHGKTTFPAILKIGIAPQSACDHASGVEDQAVARERHAIPNRLVLAYLSCCVSRAIAQTAAIVRKHDRLQHHVVIGSGIKPISASADHLIAVPALVEFDRAFSSVPDSRRFRKLEVGVQVTDSPFQPVIWEPAHEPRHSKAGRNGQDGHDNQKLDLSEAPIPSGAAEGG